MKSFVVKKSSTRWTIGTCFTASFNQAIIVNFAPLLFLTFQDQFAIPLSEITLLITVNFATQFLVDFLSAGFVDRIGYRASIVLSQSLASLGLISLALLPDLLPSPFLGLLIATLIYAVGGGLAEVVISPIAEACPTRDKERTMSLVHAFYGIGHIGLVLLSTLYFAVVGIEHWRYLSLLFALLPAVTALIFTKVRIYPLVEQASERMHLRDLSRSITFWLFFLIMLAAGAAELSMSQWVSTLAEKGLGLDKATGDLIGTLGFAFAMSASRLIFARYSQRISLGTFMLLSGALSFLAFLVVGLVPSPAVALGACILNGFAVGMLWPGALSRASHDLPKGGTLLFATLALGGDIGCTTGPALVGWISSATGGDLRRGILLGALFPAILLICLLLLKLKKADT